MLFLSDKAVFKPPKAIRYSLLCLRYLKLSSTPPALFTADTESESSKGSMPQGYLKPQ